MCGDFCVVLALLGTKGATYRWRVCVGGGGDPEAPKSQLGAVTNVLVNCKTTP